MVSVVLRAGLVIDWNDLEVLHPDPAEQDHGRDLAEPGRRVGRAHGRQECVSIAADLFGMSTTGCLALRDVQIVRGFGVTLAPGFLGVGTQPLGSSDREGIERGTQGLGDSTEAVEAAHGPQNMRAVGALTASRDQKPALAAQGQERVEQERLGVAGHERRRRAAAHLPDPPDHPDPRTGRRDRPE